MDSFVLVVGSFVRVHSNDNVVIRNVFCLNVAAGIALRENILFRIVSVLNFDVVNVGTTCTRVDSCAYLFYTLVFDLMRLHRL